MMGAIVLSVSNVKAYVVNINMETESDVGTVELPLDLAEAFRQASGSDDRPETLEEGFRAIEDRMNGGGFTVR